MKFKVNDKVTFSTSDEFNGLLGYVEEVWGDRYLCFVDKFNDGHFSFDETELVLDKENLFDELYERMQGW